MRNSVVVVGSINADLSVRVVRHPKPGETVSGAGGTILAGGKGANQACAAARLGANVTLIGAVGADAYAQPALAVLSTTPADLTAVAQETDVPTGLAIVTLDDAGENSIVVIPGANAKITDEFVHDHRNTIANAHVVVLQGEIPSSGIEETAVHVTQRLVINPAPVLLLSSELLAKADPIVVNEHEAVEILTLHGQPASNPHDYENVARELLALGVKSAIITLGGEGSIIAQENEIVRIPATKAHTVVDTTGAGDAFVGSLSYRLAEGDDLITAARYASRVGAFAVQKAGAQASYPDACSELPQ
ncbi:ribokinase [Timonella sp. A28]|uniref:ribokinase n=1 Tax=Timonella sp. A28 TaxID=3442640 RepID=UPI003EBDD0D6